MLALSISTKTHFNHTHR